MAGRGRGIVLSLVGVFLAGTLFLPGPSSAYTARAPIFIDGDGGFTSNNGVVSGTGTAADPYVISGWEISTTGRSAIEVRNTRAHFVVRDVFLHYSGSEWNEFVGVGLANVWNGTVDRANIRSFGYGVRGELARDLAVRNSALDGNLRAFLAETAVGVRFENNRVTNHYWSVLAFDSTNVTVSANWFENNTASIQIQLSREVTVTGNNVTRTSYGISLSGCEDVTISGNNLWNSYGGIELWTVRRAMVQGNRIDSQSGGARGGLFMVESDHVRVERNQVLNATAGAIATSASSELVFRDNVLTPASGRGLTLAYGNRAEVSGNRFGGNGTGLWIEGFTNATVTANTFDGNGITVRPGDLSYMDTRRNNVSVFRTHRITPDNLVNGKPVIQYRDCNGVTVDGVPAGQLIFANCTGVTVRNEQISDTDVGIQMAWTTNALVEASEFSSNRVAGAGSSA